MVREGNSEETSNRASWNEFQKAHLVKLLVEFQFHRPGARKQIGWSSVAWNEITTRFNAQFSNTNFSLKQIKEQEHTLKKQYKTIRRLRNQPGIGWDITTNMVTAPEDVWAPLLKDKENKRWYNKPFPYYDALHKVYCGFIATGKRKMESNCFTNNEVEFEPTIPTIHARRDQRHFDVEENSPISTQPSLNFAQEPSPIHPSISTQSIIASMREQIQLSCASIEKKSERTATHNEEFSVSAFVTIEDFDFALIDNAGESEAMIDQHKAKQRRRSREELEQDANQNQSQSKLEQVISSMVNGRKRQWEEREQDASQNHPQLSQLQVFLSVFISLMRQWEECEQDANQNHPQPIQAQVILSMIKNWKRLWEELGLNATQNQPQSKLLREISSMINGRKPPWEELELDANQNLPQSSLMQMMLSSLLRERLLATIVNGILLYMEQTLIDRVNDELFQNIMRNPQYNIEEAVPTQRTLHNEDLPSNKLFFANQVPQTISTDHKITPTEIQELDDANLENNADLPNSSNLHADENFKRMLADTTEIHDLAELEIPLFPLPESDQCDEFDWSAFLDGGSTSN